MCNTEVVLRPRSTQPRENSIPKEIESEHDSAELYSTTPPHFICGGPVSRRRRQRGITLPGVTTEPPCSWGIQIRWPGPPCLDSLESEKAICGHGTRGTRTREWLRWRGPASIVNGRPILSSERMLYKGCNGKCSVGQLVVILKGCVPKMNWLGGNRQ
jgi:hypothetical protein